MSLELLRYPAYIWVILLVANMVWALAMVIMHFFMPKAMLDSYFKEPYFSRTELVFFRAFPFNFFKDIMFMRLAAWPSCGERRGMAEAYSSAPFWFRRISKVLISILLVIFPMLLVMCVFLAIGFWILDHS